MRVRDGLGRSRTAARTSSPCSTPASSSAIPTSPGASLTGYDFVNNDTNAGDDNGHGTWVAGIIAANAERRIRDRRHQLDRQDHAGQDHEPERHRQHRGPHRRDPLGRRQRRRRDQHERRRLPVLAAHAGRGQLRVGQGRRARRRRRKQPARGDLLPGQLRERHQRERHAGRRRVQQLVELRAEGRRQRSGIVGADDKLLRVHVRRS